ncbi:hypothetical protein AAMO2058_001489800 [Amorphochlora amoebiformis]
MLARGARAAVRAAQRPRVSLSVIPMTSAIRMSSTTQVQASQASQRSGLSGSGGFRGINTLLSALETSQTLNLQLDDDGTISAYLPPPSSSLSLFSFFSLFSLFSLFPLLLFLLSSDNPTPFPSHSLSLFLWYVRDINGWSDAASASVSVALCHCV